MDRKNQNDKPQPENTPSGQAQPNQEPDAIGHWQNNARKWDQFGPPLHPSAQDTTFITEVISSWTSNNGTPRALILGVTPQLYHLPWPDGTDILAVDHTQEMIDNVWPGPRNTAILAEWTDMPLQAASRDIALCDGGISLLTFPHQQHQFVQELHRIITSDGLCMFRLFAPPKERESFDKVFQDLLDGKIANVNQLKIRLWMAMYKDITQCLELKDVWDAFHQASPDLNILASQIDWPLEHLQMINTHRNCETKGVFPSVDEVRHLFCKDPGGFEFEAVHVPKYDLGECCPTVVFRRIDAEPISNDS
jgi:hypothetical protein